MTNNHEINEIQMGGGKSLRQSNFELLRIVAMSMILIHHFLIHAITPDALGKWQFGLLDGFVYAGVNLFFMISGRFQIKLSVRSVVRFIILLLAFRIVNFILLYSSNVSVGIFELISGILFPLSSGPYWFIRVYFLLMLVSPILNGGLAMMSTRKLMMVVAILTIVTAYSAFVSDEGSYHFYQALFFYVLGYWLGNIGEIRVCDTLLMLIFVACCLMWACSYVAYSKYAVRYSNLFMIIAPACLYVVFNRLNICSPIINSISSASLGCYLLQDGLWGSSFLYYWQNKYTISHDILSVVGMFAVSFLLIWLASIVLTKFINPIAKKASNIIGGRIESRFAKCFK